MNECNPLQNKTIILTDHFRQRWKERCPLDSIEDATAAIRASKICGPGALKKLRKRKILVPENRPGMEWRINQAEKLVFLCSDKGNKLVVVTVLNVRTMGAYCDWELEKMCFGRGM